MNENLYRVVARAPGRDSDTIDQIGAALSRTFKLDPVDVATQITDAGVTVCRVQSYDEGRVYAKRVRDLGADSLVLDPTGKVVEQTGAPKADAIDPPVTAGTMMGGFTAPPADALEIGFMQDGTPAPVTPSAPAAAPGVPQEDLLLESPGSPPPAPMASTVAPPSSGMLELDDTRHDSPPDDAQFAPPADVGVAQTKLERPITADGETRTLDASPSPAPAPAPAPGGFSALDRLDANALVLLDGSTDEQHDAPPPSVEHAGSETSAPDANTSDGASSPASAPAASAGPSADEFGATIDEFAPPDQEEDLELDTSYQEHQEGVTGSSPEDAQSGTASEHEPLTTADEDDDDGMDWIPADGEGEAGPRLTQPPKKPPPKPTGEQPGARRATGGQPAARRMTGEHAVRGWRGVIKRSRSPLDLPTEIFRFHPRLRILAGFVLALLLGAIAPTCYASSVLDEQVQPLLVDLSTAKAHGQLMAGSPGYRTPDQIEEDIGSIKTRHGVYAFLMWLLVGGGVGFGWFRFIRSD